MDIYKHQTVDGGGQRQDTRCRRVHGPQLNLNPKPSNPNPEDTTCVDSESKVGAPERARARALASSRVLLNPTRLVAKCVFRPLSQLNNDNNNHNNNQQVGGKMCREHKEKLKK